MVAMACENPVDKKLKAHIRLVSSICVSPSDIFIVVIREVSRCTIVQTTAVTMLIATSTAAAVSNTGSEMNGPGSM